jgi:hypothetical protein
MPSSNTRVAPNQSGASLIVGSEKFNQCLIELAWVLKHSEMTYGSL